MSETDTTGAYGYPSDANDADATSDAASEYTESEADASAAGDNEPDQ